MTHCVQKLLFQWNVATLNVAFEHEVKDLKIKRDPMKKRNALEGAIDWTACANRKIEL